MNGFYFNKKNIDRIYRIVGIIKIPGFRKKPGIGNPLRGKSNYSYNGTVYITVVR